MIRKDRKRKKQKGWWAPISKPAHCGHSKGLKKRRRNRKQHRDISVEQMKLVCENMGATGGRLQRVHREKKISPGCGEKKRKKNLQKVCE